MTIAACSFGFAPHKDERPKQMTKLERNQREQETLHNELFLSNQTDSENGFLVNRLTVDCSRQRGRVVGLAPPTNAPH